MLPKSDNPQIQQEQAEYYRSLAKRAIQIGDHEGKGTLDKKEVSYVYKYLLQFPSEAQVRDSILQELDGDEPSGFVAN